MIRSGAFFVWLVVSLAPYTVALLLLSAFVRGVPLYRVARTWLIQLMWVIRHLGGVGWRVHGLENVPPVGDNQPVVLAAKHQSTWETFALPVIIPQPLAYVFKRELLRIPFFGWALARLDMVHIDRGRRKDAWNRVAEQGRMLMEKGVWIIMFPEGTRTERGARGVYKSGATRLAVATGAPVVPIAVTSAQCWPRRTFMLRPGTIDVSIGKPMPSAGREPDEFMREVERWIEEEMRRLAPEDYE